MVNKGRSGAARRRGGVAVEAAIILNLTFLLILGVIVLGLGVFRSFEMAHLAREGARWASVHGTQYAADTRTKAATAADVYTNAIKPQMALLDPKQFTYSVTWNAGNSPYSTRIDSNQNLVKVANTVTVTVSYRWIPEAYFKAGTMTSTSVMPMMY